ncbi:MAG: winged helix-turn-helix domain-containing protein [Candidatus Omnitrophota bacterium]|nr:winged helix-turn-helix domain-containing protein [Candidatus Omnitrophota bacterium]
MISITEIGIAAGDIWHYLDENGEATLDQLEKKIAKKRELILMSLGWLAREGHVTIGNPEAGFPAKLAKRQPQL